MSILKSRFKRLSAVIVPLTLLSACGGGGSANPATATTIHIATDPNNQKALLAPNLNQNTYTFRYS